MDFLSDTTKKERRNLLAAGFAGIMVALLKVYPTEIDLVGLKLQSPDLPIVVVGGLWAAITYFLIKFYSSYLYEKSFATRAVLTDQISEGRTSMDIVREEQALDQEGRALVEQQKVFQRQQENAGKRITDLQEKIGQTDIAHEQSLKITDQKINGVQQILANESDQYIRTLDGTLTPRENIEKQLQLLQEGRTTYLQNREMKRQQDIENLENEKSHWKELSEALGRDLANNENAFKEKRGNIIEWKKAHKVVGMVSPLHLVLEIWFPLLIGALAIGSLVYLMFHFPPPPKPPSLPEF